MEKMDVVKVYAWRNEEERCMWLLSKIFEIKEKIDVLESKEQNEFTRSNITRLIGKLDGMELAMLCLGYELKG